MGGVWGRVNPVESIQTIITALERGVPAIDTAPAYGHGELFVGKALKLWSGPKPIVSTKVGRLKSYAADEGHYDYSNKAMTDSIENSLSVLGTDNIDILFLHDPSAIPTEDIERVLERLLYFKEKGYVQKLGLGGNPPDQFRKYLNSQYFDIIMEYNKLNACCIDAMEQTLAICQLEGMKYYAASPLNMGLLGSSFDQFIKSPPKWLEPASLKRAQQIGLLAKEYRSSTSELAHRFLLNLRSSFKIVLGPSNGSELKDTLQMLDKGPLTDQMFQTLLSTLND